MAAMDRGLPDEDRARRRAAAAERTQRQRRLAVGALVALAVAVLLVAGVSLGGGDSQVPELATGEADATETVAGKSTPTGKTTDRAGNPPDRATEPPPAESEPPGRSIPILMYHVTEAAPAGAPFPELWVTPDRFAGQMQAIEDAGYTAITMRDAEDYWAGKRRVPRKPIVLTFDDGYRSHVDVAMPELERRGWPGVLYLEVAAMKKPGAEGVSQADVRKLIAAGWELGAHTMTHPDLTTLDAAGLTEEIAGSRKLLRKRFGGAVDAFCYPAGKYDNTVVAAVEDAGYASATTVEDGLAGPGDEPFTRHRIRVNGSDSGATVVANIAAAGG
jgi:peptidoglycan/xylan/chitin deacetylase (PgdA/CDA1 family)